MRPEVKWWIDAGERDLRAASELYRAGLFEGTAFHCQQAAEKFLKGLLVAAGGLSQRSHSCVRLLSALGRSGITPPGEVATACRRLDPHYVDARYPNGVGGAPEEFYDATIAEALLGDAETVRSFVRVTLENLGR
ncbi:MAG: HEPN domain-containing protein [Firmicutes bacterium]|nr:HEPN domain-containing protein [Bacillota bacterium]